MINSDAFNHLLKMARGTSRGEMIARDFLLWWWNEDLFGVFDFHRLVHLDGKSFKAVMDLSREIFSSPTTYPSLGSEAYGALRELVGWELERRNRLEP
ncbi:DUF7673 family protein [Asaia bogorensis]|uniref:DUF7673 family protein n=1 Tax=Asaia bogorensis TaxID=91915 RepID=UPI0028649838|nr:hypothetical protein [Asaia bogorensis]MDR6183257.1 hypothetical protein [Asaia bogorensis NBRC 16594]